MPDTDLTPEELAARAVAYDNRMLDLVREHGWALQAVFPTEDSIATGDLEVPFVYTVGSALFTDDDGVRAPELILFGLPHDLAGPILNDLVKRHRSGERVLVAGGLYGDVLEGGYDVALVEVTDPDVIDTHLATGRRVVGPLLGDRPTVLQVVWPDEQGRLPWDEGYNEEYRVVPLLGEFVATGDRL